MEVQFQPGGFGFVWILKVLADSNDLDLIKIVLI